MMSFGLQFQDLMLEMPFQLPENLLMLGRTVAILSGMCSGLDPEFNLWTSIAPYANELIEGEGGGGTWETILEEGTKIFQVLIGLPARTDRVLTTIERGQLSVQTPMLDLRVRRLERTVGRVSGCDRVRRSADRRRDPVSAPTPDSPRRSWACRCCRFFGDASGTRPRPPGALRPAATRVSPRRPARTIPRTRRPALGSAFRRPLRHAVRGNHQEKVRAPKEGPDETRRQGRGHHWCGSGMGRAMANLFAAEGAKIVAAEWHAARSVRSSPR